MTSRLLLLLCLSGILLRGGLPAAAAQELANKAAEPAKAEPEAKVEKKADAEPLDPAKAAMAKDFRAARQTLAQQLRDKDPEKRAAAVKKLAGYPGVDAAKMVMLQGLVNLHQDVRHGCLVALLQFSSLPEVTDYLRGEVAKDVRKGPAHFATAAALAVLLVADGAGLKPETEAHLDKLMDLADGPALLIAVVDELSQSPDDASLKLLLKLGETQYFRKKFGPRRALAQALIKMQRAEAVTALLATLRMVQGETRADIVRYLTELNGQRLNTDEAWLAWWKGAQATFAFAPPQSPKTGMTAPLASVANVPSYYGLPMYGTKIVFVLDASGSMRGPRIEAAKRELMQAIYDLPDGTEFNVLAFSDFVLPWQTQLVVASKETKPAAQQFVRMLGLGSHTYSYDALEAALTFDAEAIFFLTDGQPNGGKVSQPAKIVAVLSKLNRVRRVTLNAIGVGVGRDGNEFDLFLKALAAENFGRYRRVDE